jgi:hypothetical protein
VALDRSYALEIFVVRVALLAVQGVSAAREVRIARAYRT